MKKSLKDASLASLGLVVTFIVKFFSLFFPIWFKSDAILSPTSRDIPGYPGYADVYTSYRDVMAHL